jgi:S-adenosylmethionine/arginine decarboxylase-like enzyme
MICKIREVKNMNTLESINRLDDIIRVICLHNRFTLINKLTTNHYGLEDNCGPLSFSLLYVLDDCHITMKTFPESGFLLFHLIAHKNFDHSDFRLIYNFLVEALNANASISTVEFDNIIDF